MTRKTTILLVAAAGVTLGPFTLMSGHRGSQTEAQREGQTKDLATQRAEQLFDRWATDYAEHDMYTRTPIDLGFSRAFSEHFTKARGRVEINFQTAQVTVSVNGLDPLPDGSAYEVWLLENVPGPDNSAAIDLGKDGDRIISLGALPPNGSLVTSVDAQELANFEVDMAAVMRLSANQKPEFVIGGMQSIRFQINRQARLAAADRSSTPTRPLDYWWGSAAYADPPDQDGNHGNHGGGGGGQGNGGGGNLPNLIAKGELLFFNETFDGNGRTCGTCHPAGNNLTIDIDFIATLPPGDLLFIAEFTPEEQAALGVDLPPFNDSNPNQPAFEDPFLMAMRGLILENIQGFDVDPITGDLVNPPVFRAPPALFNLEFTAPYGLSACCPNLKNFAVGAVIQHFTKTLAREPGVDFRIPKQKDLKALEAFMLSNLSPADGNFAIAGEGSLLSTEADPLAVDISRPEVSGREAFLSVGCTSCHGGPVFDGGNFATGVEDLPINSTLPTRDIGNGSDTFPRFQAPQVFGLRKPAFFHNNAVGNNVVPIFGETLRFTNLRDAVAFYNSDEFSIADNIPLGGLNMTAQQIDDIAAFLGAISDP